MTRMLFNEQSPVHLFSDAIASAMAEVEWSLQTYNSGSQRLYNAIESAMEALVDHVGRSVESHHINEYIHDANESHRTMLKAVSAGIELGRQQQE